MFSIQSLVCSYLQYYLNVCRPLIPQYGLSCNANSAACRAILNGTKNPEQEQVSAMMCPFSLYLCVCVVSDDCVALPPVHCPLSIIPNEMNN